MGQRLNIEITENGKPLANGYFHWSAYSFTSAAHTEALIKILKGDESGVLSAIKLLESTGAGLTVADRVLANGLFPGVDFQDCTGRNHGLISISERGMAETRAWEDGRVTIDIGAKTVDFNVWFCHTQGDLDENNCGNYTIKTVFNPHNLRFDQIEELVELISDMDGAIECGEGFAIKFEGMPKRRKFYWEENRPDSELDLQLVAYTSIY